LFKSHRAFAYRQCAHQAEEVYGEEEKMKHPSESDLALFAAGDLSWAKQKLTGRHVAQCGACQTVVVEYSEFRPGVREFPKLPAHVQWSRLSAEMSANIHLGLEAGECVNPRAGRARLGSGLAGSGLGVKLPVHFGGAPSWHRLGIACAVLCAVAGVAFMIQHPPSMAAPPVTGTVLEASERGLQISEGTQTLRLLNTDGTGVSRTVGARGEVGARYLDPNGYVTVSQVYGE
jgi:hypothetical protein